MKMNFILLLAAGLCSGLFVNPAQGQAPQPVAQPAPPPSAPPQRSAADLEKLVGPIALYPDPLIAVMLPAACYPLEIVQAARFVANTNNMPKIDDQSWDENVKAVAKVPTALKQMNDDLDWTSELGQAFIDQQKEVMDMIQTLRNKAATAGTLQSSPQQNVVVTNSVVQENTGTQVVYVTNQIVQIEPSNPEVIYVPQYVPSAVYYPPPSYVPNPVAPLVTFGIGMAVGAAINNDCDWGHGGIYVGGHGWHGGNVNVNQNVNVNRNVNVNQNINKTANRTEWKPDSNRLRSSGAPGAAPSYQTREARGWNASGAKPATYNQGAAPRANAQATRPAQTARQNAPPPASRPNASQPSTRANASRPPPSSGQSAFSGVDNGAAARSTSQRGAASYAGAAGTARGGGARTGGRGGGSGGGGGRGGRR